MQDEIGRFNIKKKKMCNFDARNYNYISDHTEFALLFRRPDLLELYYYDVESKFTSYVTIPFFQLKCNCGMKVVNRTVWLAAGTEKLFC